MVEYLVNFRGNDVRVQDLVSIDKIITDVTFNDDTLSFNGTSSCIKSVLPSIISNNDFTLNLRYKLNTNTSGDVLIYNGDFQLYNNGTSIIFNIKGNKLYVCDADTNQHQITITRAGGVITAYVDGIMNSNTITCADELSDKNFYLATNNGVNMDVSTDNIIGGGQIVTSYIELTNNKHQMSAIYPNTYTAFEEIPDTVIAKDISDLGGLFYDCSKLKSVDLSHIDTSNTQYISMMFCNCQNLEDVDVSNLIISSKCNSLNSMFSGCRKLKKIDISNWDTSGITDMSGMFYGCWELEEIVGAIDLSSNPSMFCTFEDCPKLTGVKFKNVPKGFKCELNSDKYTILNYK